MLIEPKAFLYDLIGWSFSTGIRYGYDSDCCTGKYLLPHLMDYVREKYVVEPDLELFASSIADLVVADIRANNADIKMINIGAIVDQLCEENPDFWDSLKITDKPSLQLS